jgi:hypothetical protein
MFYDAIARDEQPRNSVTTKKRSDSQNNDDPDPIFFRVSVGGE